MIRLPPWVYTYVVVAVTTVWLALNLIDPLIATYTVPSYVQAIMGVVAGGAFGGHVVMKRKEQSDDAE